MNRSNTRLVVAGLATVLLKGVTDAQTVIVFDSQGFAGYTTGTIHLQDAGIWHPNVPSSTTFPALRHWEVPSGGSPWAIDNSTMYASSGGRTAWLQMGWEGPNSDGSLGLNVRPTKVTIDFSVKCEWSSYPGSTPLTITGYRNAPASAFTEQFKIQLGGILSVVPYSGTFRVTGTDTPWWEYNPTSSPTLFTNMGGLSRGSWYDVRIEMIQAQPSSLQYDNSGLLRFYVNGVEQKKVGIQVHYMAALVRLFA